MARITPQSGSPIGRTAIARLLLLGVLVLAPLPLGACNSGAPTVPLPPPALLTAPDASGIVTVEGDGAEAEALVFALNEDTGRGVIETARLDGSYTLRIAASPGDAVSIWQRLGTVDSPVQNAVVPAP